LEYSSSSSRRENGKFAERDSDLLDVHVSSLATSTALSSYYVPEFIDPLDIIKVLNDANVRFMLAGLHGLGGWMHKPRATQDVDILIWARHHKKAVRTLGKAFPHLEIEEFSVVTRCRDRDSGNIVIDLMKANQGVFRAAFRHTKKIKVEDQEFLIPSLEMAVVMKFAPMVSPNRPQKNKFQDAHDFMHMIDSNPELDHEVLRELGEMVYAGGGAELLEMVRVVRAGEQLKF
jgi:hypothetical protein